MFAITRRRVILALATFAALALVGIDEISHREAMRALAEIGKAQQVRLALNAVLENVLEAETGQRGYLLTGKDSYRAPYDHAVQAVNKQLATLGQLYAGRPPEAQQLHELTTHVARKLAELDVSLRMQAAAGDDGSRFVISTGVGQQEMEKIRSLCGELVVMSDQSLQQAKDQITHALELSRIGIAVVALAALAAFYLYLRQTDALRQAGERQQQALQRERNALEDQVRQRTASLAELATHLQNVRESERGHLARELHDELGSLLTAAKLDAARLKSRLTDIPDASERLRHLTELLNSGIALKRRIIEDLRPSSLANLGVVAALEILGRESGERAGLRVDMALEQVPLNEAQQLIVYRTVQESLTNTIKYAQATQVSIALRRREGQVALEISDNGRGFDVHRIAPSTHGLTGMRHRVEAAGGRLTVRSTLGSGTRIRALLPILPAGTDAGTAPTPKPLARESA